MRWRMVSWGISSQTWTKASAKSWTVCAATWRWWMERDMMSQMCSIGFRSGERAGQSIASLPSACRNCWHTPATWGLALSYIRRNPGHMGPTSIWAHNGSEDLISVPNGSQATSGEHMEGCALIWFCCALMSQKCDWLGVTLCCLSVPFIFLSSVYTCVLILRKALMFMVRFIRATTVLLSRMRLLNHHPFGEVGCDSMINWQAPHWLYATQDKLVNLVI